jgi:tetratricopeptide (TPR) repeat protein
MSMFPHQKLDWNLRRLEKRTEEAPDDAAARVELASASASKAMFHEGGEVWFNKALTHARRVLQSDPTNAAALVVAGLSLVELDRLDPAERHLDEAQKLANERGDTHLALGLLLQKKGDRGGALRELELACRLAPDAWEAHATLGRMLGERAEHADDPAMSKRLTERSQFHVIRALQLGPSPSQTPPLLLDLGLSTLRAGRLDEAHRIFQRLLEHDKYKSKARQYLGMTLYHLGKYKNAILFLRQHLEDRPDAAPIWARIGMCHLHLGEVEKAREACNRALAIEPDDLQAKWTLGCALLEEGKTDDAVRLFRDILHEAPDHLPAYRELVQLRVQDRDQRWLIAALRSEVAQYDRLPLRAAGAERKRDRRAPVPEVQPRRFVRERVKAVIRGLGELEDARRTKGETVAPEDELIRVLLDAMDLCTDEGLRFLLWDAALEAMASGRAQKVADKLKEPGRGYGAAAGRDALVLASILPEPLLVRGLQIEEDDLKRAAVDRHGPAKDVAGHRSNVDRERQEARAWQALLLLGVAVRGTRSGKNLLMRWASDADQDLADAARAGLAMHGDQGAIDRLRERARPRGAEHLVDALVAWNSPSEQRFQVHPVSDDEVAVCTCCGKRAGEVAHLIAGENAVLCTNCATQIARERRELTQEDPNLGCELCGRTNLEARAVYLFHDTVVCATCVDYTLGLLEREEIDRYLATV